MASGTIITLLLTALIITITLLIHYHHGNDFSFMQLSKQLTASVFLFQVNVEKGEPLLSH